jgi:hypothetical protein
MCVKPFILTLILSLISFVSFSQSGTYIHSYTDPCSGLVSQKVLSNGDYLVTVLNQSKTFTKSQFNSGDYMAWISSVFASVGQTNPCGTTVGLSTTIDITQTSTLNLLSIVTSVSTVSDLAGNTDILSGLSSLDGSSGDGSDNNNNKKNGMTTGNNGDVVGTRGNNSGGDGTVGSNGSNSGTDGTVGSNGSNSGNNGSNGLGGNNVVGNNTGSNSGGSGGSVNLIGSSVNSMQNSPSSASSKNGNRPNILASSDFVGFNFKNSDVSYGGKVSGGYTSMNWDGTKAHGILADYTSAMNGPNVTGFYALMKPKRIDIISISGTMGFGSKLTAYSTLSIGQMWKFKKLKKLKAVWMITGSYGSVYEKPFFGTAFIAGSMYDLKVSKRIEVKLLGLYVYAPYVKYYNDIVLKSPNVILPIIGTNIGITKRFKFNVNIGGAYAINVNTLNYTIMFGTRMLL